MFFLYFICGAAECGLYHCILEEKYKISLKDVSAVELQGLIQQLNNLNHKLQREEI